MPILGEVRFFHVVLRLRGTKKFQARLNFYFLKITYEPFTFAKNSFSKIRFINSDKDCFMWRSWVKMSKFIELSLRLSGTEFSLV